VEETLYFLFSQNQRKKLMFDLWNSRIYEVNRYILQKDLENLMNFFKNENIIEIKFIINLKDIEKITEK
jgi:RIO-like serine/threonine protein kinase